MYGCKYCEGLPSVLSYSNGEGLSVELTVEYEKVSNLKNWPYAPVFRINILRNNTIIGSIEVNNCPMCGKDLND